MANCKVCGRPLTDPESVRLGIGPVCREGSGLTCADASPVKAKYTTTELDGVLVLLDEHGPKSLTNDIEQVLAQVALQRNIAGKLVVYRDSDGRFDGIHHKNGVFTSFYPLGQSSVREAVRLARLRHRVAHTKAKGA